jgi:flagellar biogenesis protein FliO
MRLLKRKSVAIFAALLFFICTAFAYSEQSSVNKDEKSFLSNSSSLTNFQQNSEAANGNLSSTLHRMMLAVSIVLILGVAGIYASKKILPKLAYTQGKKIKVVETVHLGSRKTVHLLEIGGQQILIGSTNDRITKLADIIDIVSEKDFLLGRTNTMGEVE